jgi:hypothetical protein
MQLLASSCLHAWLLPCPPAPPPAHLPTRLPSCPDARMENLGSQADFYEIWYLNNFRKSIDKI